MGGGPLCQKVPSCVHVAAQKEQTILQSFLIAWLWALQNSGMVEINLSWQRRLRQAVDERGALWQSACFPSLADHPIHPLLARAEERLQVRSWIRQTSRRKEKVSTRKRKYNIRAHDHNVMAL